MTILNYGGAFLQPGMLPTLESIEPQLTAIMWGDWKQQVIGHYATILAATVDAGNTNQTTHLRPGLILGQVATNNDMEYKQWDPTATDGSQDVAAILLHAVSTQFAGSTANRFTGYILRAGNIKAKGVIIPGEAVAGVSGKTLEYEFRKQCYIRFRLDDQFEPYHPNVPGSRGYKTQTTNLTVPVSDYGVEYNTLGAAGAVTFTLPATPLRGLSYAFRNLADQNMVVTSPSANMIAFNNLAATSLTFSTAAQKIGAYVSIEGNGTKWVVTNRSFNGQTLTIA